MQKIISFDLWKTLIRSNPDYKKKRAEELAKNASCPYTEHEVYDKLRKVEKMLSNCYEKYSLQLDNKTIIKFISNDLGIPPEQVYTILHKCIMQYPPEWIYPNEYYWLFDQLIDKGYKLIIVSNTDIITGEQLKISIPLFSTVYNEPYFTYFSEVYFSDEIGIPKPNSNILPIHVRPTIHVGDKVKVDGKFAANVGAKFFHVNSENSISNLLNFI